MAALAEEWLRLDQDQASRSEIEGLLEQNNIDELNARLSQRISFGTAGLRAQMGAGFSRMNSLTIIQTSQGLAAYLLDLLPDAAARGVVVGHDSRHNSEKFAQLAAAAFVEKGLKVHWYQNLVHTPMVPFAVKTLKAACGIMITASHNPAQDNGYKVYGLSGCQINSPADSDIAKAILRNLEPVSWHLSSSHSLLNEIDSEMDAAYYDAVAGYLKLKGPSQIPRLIYTPMHGVGFTRFSKMLQAISNTSPTDSNEESTIQIMTIVDEQAKPDPDFPTVKYPNPEEDGALDLAKKLAWSVDSEGQIKPNLILANDPDADRFAAAYQSPNFTGNLTGDQTGVLLAYYIFSKLKLKHQVTKDDVMLTTAVSSSMLSRIASKEGFTVEETLTGFKWLGNRALELEREGKRVHFAYEEALGYMFPSIVYDKDGIVAAGLFLSLCAEWGSPAEKLKELYRKYGYFHTGNTYWRSPNTETTLRVFRDIKGKYPGKGASWSVGDSFKVVRWRDLSSGYDDGMVDGKAVLPSSLETMMVTCWFTGPDMDGKEEAPKDRGGRFNIRASGTEPKIKAYIECWGNDSGVVADDTLAILRALKYGWFAGLPVRIEEKNAHV